jgi:Leucine-rich repeat (LRR) protein
MDSYYATPFMIGETVLPRTTFCLKYLDFFYIRNASPFPSIQNKNSDFQLPPEIERLAPSFTQFIIIDTKVTQLPEEIGRLKRLTTLVMHNTDGISLPDVIGNLTSLEFLKMNINNLLSLPKMIENIKLLRFITINGCGLLKNWC